MYLRGLRRSEVGINMVSLMCFFAPAREGRRSARKSVLIFGCFYKTEKLYRRVPLGCRDVDYVVKLWDKEDLSGLSYNAGGWAKFGRPKNACVFEGGRIWLSPHGRARHRAQLARAKPGGGPEVGRRSAYALVICRRALCQRRLSPYESGLKLSKLF